jgi:pimeloyl-ACP methyl ester carboxylesterase
MKIPIPDVIVLLPGITGSALAKDGKEFWAPTPGAVLRNLITLGGALKRGLVVADDDWTVDDLGDGVTATRLMPDVHLVPGLWKIDGYGEIERFLLSTFDLKEGKNYFPFPYDWRRDNRASAKRLNRQSAQWLADWRRESGRDDAQLVIIAHSMGGLVARYYIEALQGWVDTRALITFGTPFYGSLNALQFLLEGVQKGLGPVRIDLTEALRSMRSVHQLVPSYKCVYVDGQASSPAIAQLPGWRSEWNSALTQFNNEVESAAVTNRGDESFLRNPIVYRPIVGADQPTKQSAKVSGSQVTLEWDRGGNNEGGDGTVPLLSGALAGTEDQRTFAPEQHARLQNYDSMLAQMKGVLSSLYHVKVEDLRAAVTSWFSYRADDIFLPGDTVSIELAACSPVEESLLPQVEAKIALVNRKTNTVESERSITVPRNLTQFDLGPMEPGTYTLKVSGVHDDMAPLSDVLVVATPEEAG